MKYFNSLPVLSYPDQKGNLVNLTNILTRAYILPSLKNNLMVFYDYTIKESDSPESIAYKYYNDQYRYWMVLYANSMFDPLFDWPLEYVKFIAYLISKYKDDADKVSMDVLSYTQDTIHHYEQSITTIDSELFQNTVIIIQIDETAYNNLIPNSSTAQFSNGVTVSRTVDKKAVSIYDYEYSLNEKKRNINLVKDVYANSLESQLSSLMK